MYCPNCDEGGKQGNFCSTCGSKNMFGKFPCPICHAPNPMSANFCEHCGKPVQEAKKEFVAKLKTEGGEKGG